MYPLQVDTAFGRDGQAFPHAPQFEVLLRTSTSQPSAALTLQLAKPVSHAMLQPAAVHTGTEFATVAQTFPQPRQFCGSVAVFTHAKLQTVRPAPHDATHAPPLHTVPAAHTAPAFGPVQSVVAPQKARSVCGSMHRLPQAS